VSKFREEFFTYLQPCRNESKTFLRNIGTRLSSDAASLPLVFQTEFFSVYLLPPLYVLLSLAAILPAYSEVCNVAAVPLYQVSEG
jgi:hypothetical protein